MSLPKYSKKTSRKSKSKSKFKSGPFERIQKSHEEYAEEYVEDSDEIKKYKYDKIIDEEKQFKSICPKHPYIPSILPSVDRIIVLGDIHGDYDVAIEMLKAGKVIKILDKNDSDYIANTNTNTNANADNYNYTNIKWTGKDTVVVQVGDQIDRCRPKGTYQCNHELGTDNDEASDIKILHLFNYLHQEAEKEGGKVISLFGNHELMNSQGQLQYVSYKGLKEFDSYVDPDDPKIKFEDGYAARKHAFAPGNTIGNMLACTRLGTVIVGSNLFVHAGILPALMEELHLKDQTYIQNVNYLIRKWLLKQIDSKYVKNIVESSKISMFWTRILGNIPHNVNFSSRVCTTYLDPVFKTFEIGSMIIGHTPQSFMKYGGINGTCSDTLWRVDNGSSAAFNNFDKEYMDTNVKTINRQTQVLEILNDKKFNILLYEN